MDWHTTDFCTRSGWVGFTILQCWKEALGGLAGHWSACGKWWLIAFASLSGFALGGFPFFLSLVKLFISTHELSHFRCSYSLPCPTDGRGRSSTCVGLSWCLELVHHNFKCKLWIISGNMHTELYRKIFLWIFFPHILYLSYFSLGVAFTIFDLEKFLYYVWLTIAGS